MSDKNNILDECNFKDIVISIPENTIEMEISLKFYENDEIYKAIGEYNLNDIMECCKTLDKYISGELPYYQITEKGREYLENLGC